MKLNLRVLVACSLLILLIAVGIHGQSLQLSMKSAMSQSEFAASGIGGLRSDQQQLIDNWLNQWTSAAVSVSRGDNYVGTGQKHYIEDNLDGKILILDDSSIWLIKSIDRVDSGVWLAISDVTVTKSRNGIGGFNYLIRCIDDKETVHAKYLGED
jgi:hypothetical protein